MHHVAFIAMRSLVAGASPPDAWVDPRLLCAFLMNRERQLRGASVLVRVSAFSSATAESVVSDECPTHIWVHVYDGVCI